MKIFYPKPSEDERRGFFLDFTLLLDHRNTALEGTRVFLRAAGSSCLPPQLSSQSWAGSSVGAFSAHFRCYIIIPGGQCCAQSSRQEAILDASYNPHWSRTTHSSDSFSGPWRVEQGSGGCGWHGCPWVAWVSVGGGKGPREQQSLQVSHGNEEGRRWDRGPPGCCSSFCEGYEINKHPGFQTHSQEDACF